MFKNALYILALIVVLLLPAHVLADDYHPYRLIVRFRNPVDQQALGSLSKSLPSHQLSKAFPEDRTALASSDFKNNSYIATFEDSTARLAAESRLAGDPNVLYVERDYYQQLFGDPLFEKQWGINNTGQDYIGVERRAGNQNDTLKIIHGKVGADVNLQQALQKPTDRDKVRVAIVDTGVDYKHPDLAANIWHNSREANGRIGVDDDFNGYIDDTVGYDFSGDIVTGYSINPDANPMDSIGHGTHCAGIVGAVTGNGIGIEGIARNVEIMCVKIFPNALASAGAAGIVYAVDHGAKVINTSWGSPFYSSFIGDAVQYAADRGVLICAASGNSGNSQPFFPSKLDPTLAVGATNSDDEVTTFSTYGDWLDICAPGQDILSLRAHNSDMYAPGGEPLIRIIDEDYYLADGTSMAAPHVTGCAALALSVAPGLTADSLKQLLIKTTDIVADPDGRIPPTYSIHGGWGRINIGRAVGFLGDKYAEIESPTPNEILSGEIAITGSAFSSSGGGYVLEAKPASAPVWIQIATGQASIARSNFTSWNSSQYDGKTELRLRVGNDISYTSTIRLANSTLVEILGPAENDTVYSIVDIIGSASAPGFRWYELNYYPDSDPKRKILITRSTELSYRDELAGWTVGQILPGGGTIKLDVQVDDQILSTTRHVIIKSALADGYPRDPGARPHYASVVGDVDGDRKLEVLTGSRAGTIINRPHANSISIMTVPKTTSVESSVALHDLDNDGADEIICVTDSGVAVLKADGSFFPGWPKRVNTGLQYNAYPTPILSDIDGDSSMEILMINSAAEIYCWRSDGASYFATRGGLFTRLDFRGLDRTFGGAVPAFLFAYDFNGDGYQDVGTLYTSVGGEGGLYMFNGKNGRPLYPDIGAQVFESDGIFGGAVADFDNDGSPEIAFCHWYLPNLAMAVRIMKPDGTNLPGWPKFYDDKIQFLTPFPAAADLDNDSIPELICVFSALDGGEVFVWHGDGRGFLDSEFGRGGGFFAGTINSLGNPVIADVDNDGEQEIVARGGALFLGKPECVFAWKLDASQASGWPVYTYADPGTVTYSPHTPVIEDLDDDGLLELYMGSSDTRVYLWNLPTPQSETSIAWGSFLRDSRHTGLLPPRSKTQTVPPLPEDFRLSQNYPNPFNSVTAIEFDMPKAGKVSIDIINILGQQVITLLNADLDAGKHRVIWNGKDSSAEDVASGVYFYRFKSGNIAETRRMVLLK